ncbi:MAG: hypothetical protein AB7V77_00940 [Candidatus Woesearchaeota archaeon]
MKWNAINFTNNFKRYKGAYLSFEEMNELESLSTKEMKSKLNGYCDLGLNVSIFLESHLANFYNENKQDKTKASERGFEFLKFGKGELCMYKLNDEDETYFLFSRKVKFSPGAEWRRNPVYELI